MISQPIRPPHRKSDTRLKSSLSTQSHTRAEYRGEVRAFHLFPTAKSLGQCVMGKGLGAKLISDTCAEEGRWVARPGLCHRPSQTTGGSLQNGSLIHSAPTLWRKVWRANENITTKKLSQGSSTGVGSVSSPWRHSEM